MLSCPMSTIERGYGGGWQSGVRGSRQLKARKAALVIVAVERRGRATGARMEVIPDFGSFEHDDLRHLISLLRDGRR